MLLNATFPSSYLGLVEATPPAKKKWVLFGTACYKFMSVKNTSLPQQYVIYSTPFRRALHAYGLSKCCDHASQKQAQTAQVLGKPPLISDTSTTIFTRHDFRAAPLFPNLNCNLCPTLPAHSNFLPFSALAETRSRKVIHIFSIRVLG